jgi:peptide/nickel transport system substrate-binding protein
MKQELVKQLMESMKTGRIDRRQFMRSALAMGITLTGASLLAKTVEAATPKRGGTFKLGKGHGQTTNTLDPGLADNGYVINVLFSIHGYMTEVAPDGSLAPGVAESWEPSPDAKVWTFNLRKGMTFHNGKSVTSADVVASMNHHRGKDSTSAAAPLMKSVTDVRADGANRVVFTLESGDAGFPFVLSDYHIPVGPGKDGKLDWQPGIGCGAYVLDKYEAGILTHVSRFDNHWDLANRAFFDAAEILSLTDTNARTTAMVTGDVDAADKLDLKTVHLLAKRPGIDVHSVAGTQHYTFEMTVDVEPFNNNDVRLALKYAIDRQELVDKILYGYGVVGNDHPIGRGQQFFNKDLPQRVYDPDKARHHLKKAGMDSVEVRLSAADAAFPGSLDAAVLYQESAKKAGISVIPVREPNDGYWSNVWRVKPFVAAYWSGRISEDQMFSTAYQTGVPWNGTKWSNARFDELLIKARAELDENKRRAMYYEMQAILSDNGGLIVPMFASYVFGTRDNIGTPAKFASNWDMDGERCVERWWMA